MLALVQFVALSCRSFPIRQVLAFAHPHRVRCRIVSVQSSLDTIIGNTYNIETAGVAQVVEQRTENPRVSGSTPLLGTFQVTT